MTTIDYDLKFFSDILCVDNTFESDDMRCDDDGEFTHYTFINKSVDWEQFQMIHTAAASCTLHSLVNSPTFFLNLFYFYFFFWLNLKYQKIYYRKIW